MRDRLVEVEQPHDSADAYGFSWLTRYIYDLSQSGTSGAPAPSLNGTPLVAHGNLATTQECLHATVMTSPQSTPFNTCTFVGMETKGQEFDSLDRLVTKYSFSGSNVYKEILSYDAQNLLGLLVDDCTGSQPCKTFTYDALGRTTAVQHNDGGVTKDVSYTFDPDGRVKTAGKSYTYDGDGRLTQSVETENLYPATLTYGYYPDGKRQTLSVSSSGLTQNNLFAYSYRDDGKLKTQAVATSSFLSSAAVTMAFAYTAAGRETGLTFTGAGSPTAAPVYTYDTYGRQSSVTIGSTASMTQETYDVEGQLLNYIPQGLSTSNFTYTTRGEISNEPSDSTKGPQSGLHATPPYLLANGVQTQYASTTISTNSTYYETVDARMGAPTGWYSACTTSCVGTPGAPLPCADNTNTACASSSFTYDSYGRLTQKDNLTYNIDKDTGLVDDHDGRTNNTYDLENRLLNSAVIKDTSNGLTPSDQRWYSWGSDGHVIAMGSGASQNVELLQVLHWDGDQLLFVSAPDGTVADVKIGTLGDIITKPPYVGGTVPGAVFYGRNPAGDIEVQYSTAGVSGNFTYNKPRQTWTSAGTGGFVYYSGSTYTAAPLPAYLGRDGLFDGVNTLQGARNFDSDIGAWTTPDAYAGQVHDPASQKKYVWNGSNAIAYSDPSGYASLTYEGYGAQSGGAITDRPSFVSDDGDTGTKTCFAGQCKEDITAHVTAWAASGGTQASAVQEFAKTLIKDAFLHSADAARGLEVGGLIVQSNGELKDGPRGTPTQGYTTDHRITQGLDITASYPGGTLSDGEKYQKVLAWWHIHPSDVSSGTRQDEPSRDSYGHYFSGGGDPKHLAGDYDFTRNVCVCDGYVGAANGDFARLNVSTMKEDFLGNWGT